MSRRRNRKYSKEQKYAGLYEDDFLKEVIGHSRQAEETERRLKEKELKSLLARDDELDGLFERVAGAGADVVQEPMDQDYGVRDCAFRDPAGNLIRINQL